MSESSGSSGLLGSVNTLNQYITGQTAAFHYFLKKLEHSCQDFALSIFERAVRRGV
jgi:hypothetical protein